MGGKIIGVCTRTRTGGLSTNRENGMKQRNTEKNTPPETRERERGGGQSVYVLRKEVVCS